MDLKSTMKENREIYLERVFAVLKVVSDAAEPLRLQDVAERIDLPKPTVHRILKSLLQLGYLENGATPRTYRGSSKLLELVPVDTDAWLREHAEPAMKRLHASLNETINLGCLEGERIRYVQILESTQSLRWTPDDRMYDELLSTALGRAIAACWTPSELDARLEHLARRAGYADPAPAREEIALARECGWAWESEQNCAGVDCVAVALLEGGRPFAGISVSVPSVRMDGERRERIARALMAEAAALSERRIPGLETSA